MVIYSHTHTGFLLVVFVPPASLPRAPDSSCVAPITPWVAWLCGHRSVSNFIYPELNSSFFFLHSSPLHQMTASYTQLLKLNKKKHATGFPFSNPSRTSIACLVGSLPKYPWDLSTCFALDGKEDIWEDNNKIRINCPLSVLALCNFLEVYTQPKEKGGLKTSTGI